MSITGPQRSVLAWRVHGSWMESFVAGRHRNLLPVTSADRLCDNDFAARGDAQNRFGLDRFRSDREDLIESICRWGEGVT